MINYTVIYIYIAIGKVDIENLEIQNFSNMFDDINIVLWKILKP